MSMSNSYTKIKHLEKPDAQKLINEKCMSLTVEDISFEEKNKKLNDFVEELVKNNIIEKEKAEELVKDCIFR